MPLSALPPDLQPTESELADYPAELPEYAELRWTDATRTKNPDAFHVPFVPDVDAYNQYRSSPLWKRIRKRVLDAAGHKCACCASDATEVHHRDYRPRVLRGDDDTPLVALCAGCHKLIDKLPNGKARASWNEKEAILADMVRREDERLAETERGA